LKDSQRKAVHANLSKEKKKFGGIMWIDDNGERRFQVGYDDSPQNRVNRNKMRIGKVIAQPQSNNRDVFLNQVKIHGTPKNYETAKWFFNPKYDYNVNRK
jgi:hypothetical protein